MHVVYNPDFMKGLLEIDPTDSREKGAIRIFSFFVF